MPVPGAGLPGPAAHSGPGQRPSAKRSVGGGWLRGGRLRSRWGEGGRFQSWWGEGGRRSGLANVAGRRWPHGADG